MRTDQPPPLLDRRLERGVLLLGLQRPPVNALSLALRRALAAALGAPPDEVRGIVLYGAGRCFSAGGELRELGTPEEFAAPRLSAHLLPLIERCPHPVVAALHGAAIGGGLELALACHGRVALADTRIALPELEHGIIPLSATVRLPRLIGIELALSMILDGRRCHAAQLEQSALFDRCLPAAAGPDAHQALISAAVERVHALAAAGPGPPAAPARTLVRHRAFFDPDPRAALERACAARGAPTATQAAALEAIRGGIELEFDVALERASALYQALSKSAARPCPPPMHIVSRP